jgi:5-methyltetrahydrofolate--homocysteine methyltransferase
MAMGKYTFFDGAMGSMLQKYGLEIGRASDVFNIEKPEAVRKVHELYVNAGSHYITTNTFGSNRLRLKDSGYSVEDVVKSAVEIASSVIDKSRIALDVGPTGEFIEPKGEYTQRDLYDVFSEQISAGQEGCGLIVIETFYNLDEAEMAIKAARDNSNLPVFCTFTFMDNGKTFTGYDIKTVTEFLNKQRVNVMGINCSTGPDDMVWMAGEMLKYAEVSLMIQPNAGLPENVDGKAVYSIKPSNFAAKMQEIADLGVNIVGGCCGTTPEFISEMVTRLE